MSASPTPAPNARRRPSLPPLPPPRRQRPPISPRRSRHEHPTHLPFVSRRLLDRRRPAGAIGRMPQVRRGAGGPRHRYREPIGGGRGHGVRDKYGAHLGGPRRPPRRRRGAAATTIADADRAGAPPLAN